MPHNPSTVSGISLHMDTFWYWALPSWAAPSLPADAEQLEGSAVISAAEGTVKAPDPQKAPCTERVGKGAGTPPRDTVPWCCSHFPCWTGGGSPEQCPGARLCHHTMITARVTTAPVLRSCCWGQLLTGEGSAGLVLVSPGRAEQVNLWLWELVLTPPASDTCLHNPQTCLVHKICLGLCWLSFQMFLGETMSLKYGFYNQSFSFGSWRQLSTALLL